MGESKRAPTHEDYSKTTGELSAGGRKIKQKKWNQTGGKKGLVMSGGKLPKTRLGEKKLRKRARASPSSTVGGDRSQATTSKSFTTRAVSSLQGVSRGGLGDEEGSARKESTLRQFVRDCCEGREGRHRKILSRKISGT